MNNIHSCVYPYGTAGFRFNENIMINISHNIGRAIGALLIKKHDKIGIMITASHNIYSDNGCKLTNGDGKMLQPQDERFLEELVNHYESMIHCELLNRSGSATVVIGNDTRKSCDTIKHRIIEGIKEIVKNRITITFVDLGLCTTPEFHSLVANPNDDIDKDTYINDIRHVIHKYNLNMSNIVVDCANGVGASTLDRIFKHDDIVMCRPVLINYNIENVVKLNNRCGSDYIMTSADYHHKMLLSGINESFDKNTLFRENTLHAAFDGDADRIVFYLYDHATIKVITGDHISLLILRYVLGIIERRQLDISIALVHTGYSNGGFIKAVDDIIHNNKDHNIKRIITPTGVKNLIEAASHYDIGIYFESNGHGSVIINNDHNIEELSILRLLFNQIIGDAIMNLIGVTYILHHLQLSISQFSNLYKDRDSLLIKVHVKDKNIYKTTYDQTTLLEPIEIANTIDSIMKSYPGCRSIVRASGTEDVVRLYVENNGNNDANLETLTANIKSLLM